MRNQDEAKQAIPVERLVTMNNNDNSLEETKMPMNNLAAIVSTGILGGMGGKQRSTKSEPASAPEKESIQVEKKDDANFWTPNVDKTGESKNVSNMWRFNW